MPKYNQPRKTWQGSIGSESLIPSSRSKINARLQMKLFVSLAFALIVAYTALVLSLNAMGVWTTVVCDKDFVLTAIACRLISIGILLVSPLASGLLGFFVARKLLGK